MRRYDFLEGNDFDKAEGQEDQCIKAAILECLCFLPKSQEIRECLHLPISGFLNL